MSSLVALSRALSARVEALRFAAPITHVYNPLDYARTSHEAYLSRYGAGRGRVVLLGMNPGPFGMAQTGVPFGDVTMVRDFLGIEAPVRRPGHEHPKRPVLGFACSRGEVSGTRLWGWARDRHGTASRFFERFFVVNYCPLVFMEASGRNFTPDKLPGREREALFVACDEALIATTRLLAPRMLVGVGAFAEGRARSALGAAGLGVPVGQIPHPSPASPLANRGWAAAADAALTRLGLDARPG